jgi:hypothetical protein
MNVAAGFTPQPIPSKKQPKMKGKESSCEGWGPERAGMRCNHATRHLEERRSVTVQAREDNNRVE